MNPIRQIQSMFRTYPSRQVRRGHARSLARSVRGGVTRLSTEALEGRAMMSATVPDYKIVQDWGSGFQAGISLANQGTTPVVDWKVSFDYAAQISSIWDARIVSHVGSTYTIANSGWNGTLDAGKTVAFGFIGAGATGTTVAAPSRWILNGVPIGTDSAPPLPQVSVGGATVAEGAGGGGAKAVFALSLSAPSAVPVSVAYRTADGTALAGSDYTATSGTVTFAPGVTKAEVSVPVIGDATSESSEAFSLVLSSPQGAALAQASAAGTILDDDIAPAGQGVSVAFTVTGQWNSGFGGEIKLTNGGTTPISGWKLGFTAPWTIASAWNATLLGTSPVTGGTRFTVGDAGWNSVVPVGGSVTIGFVGAGAGTIAAPTEWTLNGQPLGGGAGGGGSAGGGGGTSGGSVTPALPSIAVTGAAVAEGAVGATGKGVFTLKLSAASATPVTVAYTTTDGTAKAGSDYTASSGTVTFPVGVTTQQVSVAVIGDAAVESDETFSLTLSAPQGATVAPTSVSVTIVNDDTPPSVVGGDITKTDKILTAYFPEWGIYGRNFQVADVPADKINHLIYSFLDLKSDGQVAIMDSYAALEKRFSAEESVSGEADRWSYPSSDPRSQQTVWGNFNQLAELKVKAPHMKVSIAVGGWTLSDHFSSVCSTAAGRETFATSLVNFLSTYRMFDGVDFDWEYPSGGGEPGNSVSPSDGVNYAALLQLVRQKFDVLGSQLERRYEISVASPAGVDKIATFNLAGLAPWVDRFNLMSYDFHGTWENTTGHQAAFTGDAAGYDIETAVKAYLAAGVPAAKVILGAPLYTRAWSGVADGGDGGYLEKSTGAAPGTFEKGVYDYKDLVAQMQASAGWKLYWDDTAQAAYVYDAADSTFSSFETRTSIAQKSDWAERLGLGGMMFWDITGDALGTSESLVDAAYESWVLGDSIGTIRSRSKLMAEIVVGGDGVISSLPTV
jgi:GH18 family chitinase